MDKNKETRLFYIFRLIISIASPFGNDSILFLIYDKFPTESFLYEFLFFLTMAHRSDNFGKNIC